MCKIFMLNDCCNKIDCIVAFAALAGSNVTMPYAEIGGSFNNSRFGLLLCWGWFCCFCCLFCVWYYSNIVSR